MQLVIEIKQEQDLQFLLSILERMQIAYRPISLPEKKVATSRKPVAIDLPAKNLSEKYAGRLSSKTAKALQLHITESRNEWERSI